MSRPEKPVCEVCIRIRQFLLVAIPLVLLVGTQTDAPIPDVPLHEIAPAVIIGALVVILSWRIVEYRREKKALARLKELQDDDRFS